MGVGKYLSAAIVAVLAATVALPARAEYCRTKACDKYVAYDDVWQTEPDPPCTEDPNTGCRLQGLPLYWPHSCLSFTVQEDGSKKQGIDFDTVHAVVAEAFATWMNADCGGGALPSVRVDDFGAAVCNQLEYNQDQGNANVFMFRDDAWPHPTENDSRDIALTTITYNRENAQILDADVEINSFAVGFTLDEEPGTDLQAILTHEVGHFFGLGHDDDENATMYKSYWSDRRQRDLGASDVRGMCAIYPPEAPISKDACVPMHGFARTCGVEEAKGCAISPQEANGEWPMGLVALVGLGLACRRSGARRQIGGMTERRGAGEDSGSLSNLLV